MPLISQGRLVTVSLLFCLLVGAVNKQGVALGLATGEPAATARPDPGDLQPAMVLSAPILRATFSTLLGEHTLLAAEATDAALHGREGEFAVALATLEQNAQELAATIGLVYGEAAQLAFLPLWRQQQDLMVAYTHAVSQGNERARTQALADLTAYAVKLGDFLATANPNLSPTVAQGLLALPIASLTATIDAQAKDDYPTAYRQLRAAYRHMALSATELTGVISQQYPERFPGAVDSAGADLRARLSELLAEHVVLLAMASNTRLHGQNAQLAAAAAALDENSVELTAVITRVYGSETGAAFLPLWRKHVQLLDDYASARASSDVRERTRVLAELTAYSAEFGAWLATANPSLTAAAIQGLFDPHITTFTALIDAQAADQLEEAYRQQRKAYTHMRLFANPLSDAIIIRFPARFGDATLDALLLGERTPATPTATPTVALATATATPRPPTKEPTASQPLTDPSEQAAAATLAPIQNELVMSAPRLRAQLAHLFDEHVGLLTSATDAALRGRNAEFAAAATALANNSVALAAVIGVVYGAEAQASFLALWTKHCSLLLEYSTAIAAGDEAARQQVLDAVNRQAEEVGRFLHAANPNLPQEAVAALLRGHVTTLSLVIDAQGITTIHASGDQLNVYPALHTALGHMDRVALALAGAIAQQFPARFPGIADTPAAELRTSLGQLLAEHTWLLLKAMTAALHARNIEYEAAFAALNENSLALADRVGALYGAESSRTFLELWRKYIGLFVDYALARIDNNAAAQEQAEAALAQHTQEFADFLSTLNPELPAASGAALLSEQTQTMLAAIDTSATDNPEMHYAAVHLAYEQMGLLAHRLSDAIIGQFPDRFGSEVLVEPGEHAGVGVVATNQ